MIFPEIPGSHRTIVIEGCDGTGKTTLARRIEANHDFTIIHSARSPDHIDLTTHYKKILDEPGRIVFDRAFVSEIVYGPLFRKHTRISLEGAIILAETVASRDGVFLHLTGSPTAIAARLKERDGCSPDLGQLSSIIDSYRSAFTTLAGYAPVYTIDTKELPGLRITRARRPVEHGHGVRRTP